MKINQWNLIFLFFVQNNFNLIEWAWGKRTVGLFFARIEFVIASFYVSILSSGVLSYDIVMNENTWLHLTGLIPNWNMIIIWKTPISLSSLQNEND